ncbi:MAG: nicotinamide riboside transporter PnuC [Clostridia bacterium]|nr:nicotinamide riboside transporter PnuC [Clostridia bacterium]
MKEKISLRDKLASLWSFFTTYEKVWFISILVLSFIFAFLFPEEDTNGVNGKIIMILYLCDILFNILCELLISKQSKWNFIVSLLVEITEIATCVVLAYRFATMAVTLFFWIPIDIISFINWHKHPDDEKEELTEVRELSIKMKILVLLLVALWTILVGYFLTSLDFGTDFFHGNRSIEVLVCYLDACLSALGIANGLFILLRIKEQWTVWFIYAIVESVINIVSGQVVLLVLKAGYLSNSIYGFIKWGKYIKSKNEGA